MSRLRVSRRWRQEETPPNEEEPSAEELIRIYGAVGTQLPPGLEGQAPSAVQAFTEPEEENEGDDEDAITFANRVKAEIARQGGLVDLMFSMSSLDLGSMHLKTWFLTNLMNLYE